jgi:hypothetical protein
MRDDADPMDHSNPDDDDIDEIQYQIEESDDSESYDGEYVAPKEDLRGSDDDCFQDARTTPTSEMWNPNIVVKDLSPMPKKPIRIRKPLSLTKLTKR